MRESWESVERNRRRKSFCCLFLFAAGSTHDIGATFRSSARHPDQLWREREPLEFVGGGSGVARRAGSARCAGRGLAARPESVFAVNAEQVAATAAAGNAPTLGDLGFTPQQTTANADMQRRLNKRTHDLKVHQTLGMVTLVPLCAAVIVAGGAKAKRNRANPSAPPIEPSSTSVDLHAALGATTATLYGLTAYYAIIAPKIRGVKPKGAIRWHRDLVWIHAPGMVLTPILGGMALSQENKGERVHGIASAHSYVAWTTIAAYGASIVAVSWPIHLKFREKK